MNKAEHENRVFNEDCIIGMQRLPDGIVDLVLTDPPFAIEFAAKRSNYNRTGSRVLDGYGEVSQSEYQNFSKQWIKQAARVLSPTGSMFIFSGYNNLKDILIAAEECGLDIVNHIIWKYQFGVATKRKFVTSHYHLLFYCKDDRRRRFYQDSRFSGDERHSGGGSRRYQDMEDVWTIPREYWTGKIKTPTKLPRAIISKILAYTTQPGDLVLDPFLGSGQTAVVAALEGRRYIGFEIVPEYFSYILERLASGSYLPRDAETSEGCLAEQPSLGLFG